ncbi:DUF3772 domain-containing protein [Derxia gummosa]|uniref:DUF3772 domain-containing protein n=1 Tax=Derxia gummosa DSM 723 TaxID=1121388 RepID=A0A8B6X8W7_9BURK|nr:DUF3772 domain-containing protein [Derxia gummosa]
MPPGFAPRLAHALTALLLLVWLTCATVPLHAVERAAGHEAATSPQAAHIDAVLDASREQLDAIQKRLADSELDDNDLARLRDDALALQQRADQTASTLAPQLDGVKARLAELGPAPDGKAVTPEAADIAAQRKALNRDSGTLDAQLKLARLLGVEAEQAANRISDLRRVRFQAALGARTASIVAPAFWIELAGNLPRDLGRLWPLRTELEDAVALAPGWVWPAVLTLLVALGAARWWLGRWLMRLTAARVPAGRLRRSALAAALALLGTLAPGLMGLVVHVGFDATGRLSDATEALLGGLVGVVFFGGYVAGLGHALLSPDRPSWRLPPLADSTALRMRVYPRLLGTVVVVGWLGEKLATTVSATLSTSVAWNCIYGLVLALMMGSALVRLERLRREALADPEQPDPVPRPTWLVLLVGAAWVALIASIASFLVGYVALGAFITRQVAWVAIVGTTTYLLLALVDDACMGLVADRARRLAEARAEADAPAPAHAGHPPGNAPTGDPPGDSPTAARQIAVLASGLIRLTLLLFAIVSVLAPFGAGPDELMQRGAQLREGLSVGEINLSPFAVLRALLVFAAGMFAVRIARQWLAERFLPTTQVDAGMRASMVSLLGYAGGVFAFALGLSAVGLSLDRIAWVASALSVGIGFGLQAVVQNFVSGLILLAERPVKVGDWVALGAVEGDIRRINVRATEIQMGDRSTVIVPNSEFITKTVRNITHANPLGLVQIKLPMPLDSDTARVRQLMLDAFGAHESVLDAPAPNVFLDGIEAGMLMFNATGFVASPRDSYGVRSALLFDILGRLRAAGITVSKAPTMVLREPSQAMPPQVVQPLPPAPAA